MDIRPGGADDAAAIAALLNAHVATTTNEWTDVPLTLDGAGRWIDDHECVLVAESDGEVVGVAAYGWFRDVVKRPGYRYTVENTVHVRRDQWRSGLGRLLMDALVMDARRTGKHRMIAAIDSANDRSLRFHRSIGFREVGRLPGIGAKHGRWLDLVLMQLDLDERPHPPDDAGGG